MVEEKANARFLLGSILAVLVVHFLYNLMANYASA